MENLHTLTSQNNNLTINNLFNIVTDKQRRAFNYYAYSSSQNNLADKKLAYNNMAQAFGTSRVSFKKVVSLAHTKAVIYK